MNSTGNIHEFNEVAVYTDTDSCVLVKGLDMDIGRVCSVGVLNDSSCELNDRSAFNSVLGFKVSLGHFTEVAAHSVYVLKNAVNVLH